MILEAWLSRQPQQTTAVVGYSGIRLEILPQSKKQLCSGESCQTLLWSALISCVAIHRPGVKVRTPGFYSSSTKALLGVPGQFLPPLFWFQFPPVSTDVSVSETG